MRIHRHLALQFTNRFEIEADLDKGGYLPR
jgi:hypothetical protein